MFGDLWFDREGKPITLWEANALLGDYDYKVVAKDVFAVPGGAVEVSTVWLGLNHRFGPGAPLIFETMLFGSDPEEPWEFQWRYPTEEAALKGHAEAVKLVSLIATQKGELDELRTDLLEWKHRDHPGPD